MTDQSQTDQGPQPRGIGPIAVVAVGRNEGARFEACARSVAAQTDRFVYVDSGSTDRSVAVARAAGAEVVDLDMSVPFTAARARNAGARRALDLWPDLAAIQFVDGDCELVHGWLATASEALADDPSLGIVTGWREERARDATVYNMMCDVEWHRPAGPITACGGDMMVRRAAFEAVDGFDGSLIAGEDEEFCLRVATDGWDLLRLPKRMTIHDVAMTRFGEWWRRAVRAGHAYAQIGTLHPQHFKAQRRRVLIYGLALPMLVLLGLLLWPPLALAALALYALSYWRTRQGLMRHDDLTPREATRMAVFLTLSKLPNLVGGATFWARSLAGRDMTLIEYK